MTDYLEDIHKYLRSYSNLSKSDFEILTDIFEFKRYDANVELVEFNAIPTKIYLLCKGVARSYVILDNGKLITKELYGEFNFFSGFRALLEQKPSRFIYETLTECYVYETDFILFKKLCEKHITIFRHYMKYLEYLYILGEDFIVEVFSMNAKERYLKLRERIPEIDNLIPQYQIAAYLNITPVQLSRIRSKLYQSNY